MILYLLSSFLLGIEKCLCFCNFKKFESKSPCIWTTLSQSLCICSSQLLMQKERWGGKGEGRRDTCHWAGICCGTGVVPTLPYSVPRTPQGAVHSPLMLLCSLETSQIRILIFRAVLDLTQVHQFTLPSTA